MNSQSVIDFCYRFSHFHPDRYEAKDRPIIQDSLGQWMTTQRQNQHKKSKDLDVVQSKAKACHSVYSIEPEKCIETPEEEKSRIKNEYMIGGLVMSGILFVSNYVLDK